MSNKKEKIQEPEIINENEEVSIEGVTEIPEGAEIVDEVKITDSENEEITEEVVQAVAEGIKEQAEEDNKKVEDIVDEIITEAKEDAGEYIGDLRGFKTLEEARNYPNTAEFKRLDVGCRTEYIEWLKSIIKED